VKIWDPKDRLGIDDMICNIRSQATNYKIKNI